VIRDFYNPDFLLIGESDARAGDVLCEIYKRACKNSPAIARMNWINAEITKLSVNTEEFLSLLGQKWDHISS